MKKAIVLALLLFQILTLTGCFLKDGRYFSKDRIILDGKYKSGSLPFFGKTWYDEIRICGDSLLPDIQIQYDDEHYIGLREVDLSFLARYGSVIDKSTLYHFGMYCIDYTKKSMTLIPVLEWVDLILCFHPMAN